MHHRTGFAHDFPALLFHTVAGFVSIFHLDGDVAVGIAQIVAFGIPVVGQFQNRTFSLAAVADESQRKPSFGIILLTQQPHPQYVLIKLERFFQIAHPQHGVEHTHNCVSFFYPFNRQSAANPALQAATLYGKRLPGGNKRCRNAFFSAKAVAPVQAFSYKVN